jgi:signal transduction histidine kinase
MLDLPSPPSPPAPPHWLRAPLPDAPLCRAQPDHLARVCSHETLAATPALLAALCAPATPGAMLLAYDSSGAAWRLLHAGDAAQPLWRVQALAESRARLHQRLRGVLAQQLLECVLHELRNPLNALGLHADLIARLLGGGDPAAAPRALSSVEVIKERLGELRRRQDAALALWLGDPAQPGGAALAPLVEHSLRLLRGHASLHQVRLHGEDLSLIGAARLRDDALPAQIALITLLVAACEGAHHNPAADGAEVLLRAVAGNGALVLEIQAPLEGLELARELADTDAEGLLATLALLLEPSGLELETQPLQALTRLVLKL